MPVITVGTGRALMRGHYHETVLAKQPVAYWPMDETAGMTAFCLTNPAMNGTYARDVATMGTQEGIGDGGTAPTFDGTNDFMNAYSPALNAAWNSGEGMIAGWRRASATGVWTDGANRHCFSFISTAGDAGRVRHSKTNANNTLSYQHYGSGTNNWLTDAGHSATIWEHFALVFSAAGNYMRGYTDAVQDVTVGSCAAWANNNLHATLTIIGARTNAAVEAWSGGLARFAVWNAPQSLAVIQDLALV